MSCLAWSLVSLPVSVAQSFHPFGAAASQATEPQGCSSYDGPATIHTPAEPILFSSEGESQAERLFSIAGENSTWFEPRRSNEPAAAGEKPILRLETFHLPTRDCHLWVDIHPILVVSLELYLKSWTLEKPRRIGTEEGRVAKVGGRGEGTPRCSGETAPPSVDTSRESKRESTASPPPDLQLLATLGSSQWDQWDQCYVHQGRKELMPARPAILLAPNEGLGLP